VLTARSGGLSRVRRPEARSSTRHEVLLLPLTALLQGGDAADSAAVSCGHARTCIEMAYTVSTASQTLHADAVTVIGRKADHGRTSHGTTMQCKQLRSAH
jgi:hypothetical protein